MRINNCSIGLLDEGGSGDILRTVKTAPKTLSRSIGHHKEWLQACRTGSPSESNFDFAGPLTETVLLGTVCIRNGGDKIVWDSANLKIANDDEANRFLHHEYREGWTM